MKRYFFLALAVSGSLVAQSDPEVRRALPAESTPSPSPEVRRAEPVNPGDYQNPAWMDRLPPGPTPSPEEPEVRKAEPVIPTSTPAPSIAKPTPVATQVVPVAPPLPVSTPVPAASPSTPPASSGEADDPGSIRFTPTTGSAGSEANRSLTAANGFYRRKMYEMSVFEYEKFLISDSNGEGRDGALFRLAESHRFLGNTRAAREGYQRLIQEVRTGEFVGAGAFRLGEILFAENNYGAALEVFRKAAENTKENEVRLTAQFFVANSLDKLKRKTEALAAFKTLAEEAPPNPYRDDARFYVAETLASSSDKTAALALYETLGNDAAKPSMQAEALVKAAALAGELGETERSRKLFDSALAHAQIGEWKPVARLGLLRLAYNTEDYKTAASIQPDELAGFPKEAQAEAILITANANRQLGNTDKALAGYERILKEFPASDSALQARFQRLLSMNSSDNDGIIQEIDAFLKITNNPREKAQANLMKAEALFRQGKYSDAAPLYDAVSKSQLPDRLKEQALFKLGWSQNQTGNSPGAKATFKTFMDRYPKSDLGAAALAQSGVALQKTSSFDEALTIFSRLINDYPKAPERELALQQKALILGQKEDFPEMVKTFEQLLAEFPKTQAAGQAHFWIGWTRFEAKDYPTAIASLKKAREADPQYAERSTLRIVLAYYYLKDRENVSREVESLPSASTPPEVTAWLAAEFFEKGEYAQAEKFLEPMVARSATIPVDPQVYLQLAQARIALEKFGAADDPIARYLATARDPASRARGLILSAEVAIAKNDLESADRLIQEALLLQPEGRLNAEARMMNGQTLAKRGNADGAARAYATVAILYDDPSITPKALREAAANYRKAGKTPDADKLMAELKQRYPEAAAN